MDKIRVLMATVSFGVGGSYVQIHSKYMNKDHFDVTACALFDDGEKGELLRRSGIKTEVLHGDFSTVEDLLRNVDILHINQTGYKHQPILRMAKKVGVPVAIETDIFDCYPNSPDVEKIVDLHLWVSKNCAWSYMNREKISIEDFLAKNRVLYDPIDVEEFEKHKPSEQQIYDFRDELGVDNGVTLICRVGRPDISKWSPFIIHMLWYLVRKIPVKLLIVGGMPKWVSRKIAKYHLEKNVIDFGVATEDELMKTYHSIDLLTHCSRIGESFGRTIGEAMAAGKPVVVNSTPWMDNAQIELVDNSVTGFVANTPNVFSDAVALIAKDKHLTTTMGNLGFQKAKGQYDARSNTRLLEKYYIEMLTRRGMLDDGELLSEYKEVAEFPSTDDIRAYPIEYQKRLRNYFGNVSMINRYWLKIKQFTQQRPRRGYIFKDTHLHIPPIF